MDAKDKDAGSKQYASGKKPDAKVAAGIHSRLHNGKLPCARAFEVARERSVPLIDVGYSADLLKIRISQCQLGLFGYEPKKRIVQTAASIDSALEQSIGTSLVDGRLPCAKAFAIAKDLRIPRIDVSSACELMNVKISSCQLGAF